MICSTTAKNQASYSSDILRVPKLSHFSEAEKGVTIWVSVTIWVVIIMSGDSYSYSRKIFRDLIIKF